MSEAYPRGKSQGVEPEQLDTGSMFDAQDEIALEIFQQLMDRFEELRRKYGEQAAKQAVEELYIEVLD